MLKRDIIFLYGVAFPMVSMNPKTEIRYSC